MITDKGNCSQCGQKVQHTTHDKCMYCGAILNSSQRFTEDEKAIIENRQKQRAQEYKKRQQSRSGHSGGLDTTGFCDTDFGGGCD